MCTCECTHNNIKWFYYTLLSAHTSSHYYYNDNNCILHTTTAHKHMKHTTSHTCLGEQSARQTQPIPLNFSRQLNATIRIASNNMLKWTLSLSLKFLNITLWNCSCESYEVVPEKIHGNKIYENSLKTIFNNSMNFYCFLDCFFIFIQNNISLSMIWSLLWIKIKYFIKNWISSNWLIFITLILWLFQTIKFQSG